jgi:hypothetical protein
MSLRTNLQESWPKKHLGVLHNIFTYESIIHNESFLAFYLLVRESSVIVLQLCAKLVGCSSELPGSRDISVGITTGYGLDSRGSIRGRIERFFSSPQRPDRLLALPSLLYSGTRALSPEVKQPEREAYYSPPFSVEIMNDEASPPLPHISSRLSA